MFSTLSVSFSNMSFNAVILYHVLLHQYEFRFSSYYNLVKRTPVKVQVPHSISS
jgi:hypothetical protein